MQLKVFGSLCSVLLLQCIIHSIAAVPISIESALSDLLLHKLNAEDQLHSRETDRQRRTATTRTLHNYIDVVLEQRPKWKREHCRTIHNCNQVSKHHCTPQIARFSCLERPVIELESGCELDFSLYVYNSTEVTGVDFSFFTQTGTENDDNVFLIELYPNPYKLIAGRYINTGCDGWQTFHANNLELKPGINEFSLALVVAKRITATEIIWKSCAEIKERFFMDNETEGFDLSTQNREARGVETNEIPTVASLNTDNKGTPATEGGTTDYQATTTEQIKRAENPVKESPGTNPTKQSPETKKAVSTTPIPSPTEDVKSTEALSTTQTPTTNQVPTAAIPDPRDFIPIATLFVKGPGEPLPIPLST